MADKNTTALTAAGTLDGTELVPITQGGNSRKATAAAIAALGGGNFDMWMDDFQETGGAGSPNHATKGIPVVPFGGVDLDSLFCRINQVSGATYRARCYEISGLTASDTITSVVDNGVDVVASANTTLTPLRLPFASTVSLSADTLYALCVSRTDGGDTYALPIAANNSGSLRSYFFPFYLPPNRIQISHATPVATDTLDGFSSAGYIGVGVIGDRAGIV